MNLLHATYNLPFLASLAEVDYAFADALQEAQAGLTREQALWDTLAMYCRDLIYRRRDLSQAEAAERIPGNWTEVTDAQRAEGVLFPVPFPEATLGRWLTAVGDERCKEISLFDVFSTEQTQRGRPWVTVKWMPGRTRIESAIGVTYPTESAARLDLKRRIAGMFGEVSREIVHRIPWQALYGREAKIGELDTFLGDTLKAVGFDVGRRFRQRDDKANLQTLFWQHWELVHLLPPTTNGILQHWDAANRRFVDGQPVEVQDAIDAATDEITRQLRPPVARPPM